MQQFHSLNQENSALLTAAVNGDASAGDAFTTAAYNSAIRIARLGRLEPINIDNDLMCVEKHIKQVHENIVFMLKGCEYIPSVSEPNRVTAMNTLPKIDVIQSIVINLGKNFRSDSAAIKQASNYATVVDADRKYMLDLLLNS